MEGLIPHPEIAPLLKQHFVALAADADAAEDEVIELCGKLEEAMMLPFVVFTDAQGQFQAGSSGLQHPKLFLEMLQGLTP